MILNVNSLLSTTNGFISGFSAAVKAFAALDCAILGGDSIPAHLNALYLNPQFKQSTYVADILYRRVWFAQTSKLSIVQLYKSEVYFLSCRPDLKLVTNSHHCSY